MSKFDRMESLYREFLAAEGRYKSFAREMRKASFDPVLVSAGLIPETPVFHGLEVTCDEWNLIQEYARFIGLPLSGRPCFVTINED